jgi:hypothetical protein
MMTMMRAVILGAIVAGCVAQAPPPNDNCRRTEYRLCGPTRNDPEVCMRCVSTHWNQTGAAGCTIPDDEQFCQVTPREVKCIDALERACGVGHPTATHCNACVVTHKAEIEAADCTRPWVEEYCHPAVVPPSDACTKEQYKVCGASRRVHPAACIHCISSNWNATSAAGCTVANDEKFCQVTPNEVECINTIEKLCGVNPTPDACDTCTKEHKSELEAAHCTAAWVQEECHPHK